MPRKDETSYRRRSMLGAGAGLIGWGVLPATASAAPTPGVMPAAVALGDMVVSLLGTGSPDLRMDRFGMATLVQAGGLTLVFDAGRGCALRLTQLGIDIGKVDAVFITHFHSDHLNGLPDLWMTGYLPAGFGRRAKPLEIHGPTGIARIADTMRNTFAADVRNRIESEHVPEAGTQIATNEFSADGVIFEKAGVTVTAFQVDHGPLMKPAYGFRVASGGRAVLLSGDTRPVDSVVTHGKGVDLLIHEVAVAPEPMLGLPWVQSILANHTTPEDAGGIFARANPKLAVFSHLVELSNPDHPRPRAADIQRRAQTKWDGKMLVGSDLDRFVLTAQGVTWVGSEQAPDLVPGKLP